MNTYQRAEMDSTTRKALIVLGVLLAGIVFLGCWDRVIAQQTDPEPKTCREIGSTETSECPAECPQTCAPTCDCPDFGGDGFCMYNDYLSCTSCWTGGGGSQDYGEHRAECEEKYCQCTSFTCERWPCACQDATCPNCTCTDWTPPHDATELKMTLETVDAKLLHDYAYRGPWKSPVRQTGDGFVLRPEREPLFPWGSCDSDEDCVDAACVNACGAGNVDSGKSKKNVGSKSCDCYCKEAVDRHKNWLVFCRDEDPEPEGIIEDPDPVGQQRETPGETQGLPQ